MTNRTVEQARVIKITRDNLGTWLLTVQCPYCGKTHEHGGGSGETPYLSGRGSHCYPMELQREYELVMEGNGNGG